MNNTQLLSTIFFIVFFAAFPRLGFTQQNSVEFRASSVDVNSGEQFDVNIELRNFIDIGAISFDVTWNPYHYEYVSNSDFLINHDALSQIVDITQSSGRLRTLYIAEDVFSGQTVNDGTIFFTLTFRAIASCGEQSLIKLGDGDPIVTDNHNNDLPFRFFNGLLKTNKDGFDVAFGVCPSNGNASGSIYLNMCGGEAPYMISYIGPGMGGSGLIDEQNGSELFSFLPTGNYQFNFTDEKGDTLVRNVHIPAGAIHQIESTLSPPTCHYSSDGNISIEIFPTSMYQIAWSTGVFVRKQIGNLSNGNYTVAVTDSNGCMIIDSFELHRDTVSVTIEYQEDSTGLDSSALIVHATGGVKPYVYTWESLSPSLDSVLSPLEPKLYRLKMSDSVGCFVTDSIDLSSLANSIIRQMQFDFTLSPNPTSSFLTLDLPHSYESKRSEVMIFDVRGNIRLRTFVSQLEDAVTLDFRAFEASEYWLTIWQNGQLVGRAAFVVE